MGTVDEKVEQLERELKELELLTKNFLDAYNTWLESADIVHEDYTALKVLEGYADILRARFDVMVITIK